MASPVSLFMVYQFIRRLVQPFEKWDAFEQGVIDADGNIIKKSKERKTKDEKDSLSLFDIMILKLKKLLGKLPFGKTKLASFAAALWLVKEAEELDQNKVLTEEDIEDSFIKFFNENKARIKKKYIEDAPANVSAQVANRPKTLFKKKKKKEIKEISRAKLVDRLLKPTRNKAGAKSRNELKTTSVFNGHSHTYKENATHTSKDHGHKHKLVIQFAKLAYFEAATGHSHNLGK